MRLLRRVGSGNEMACAELSPVFATSRSELAAARLGNRSEVIPIIPDAARYIRDMNKYGAFGMALRRLRQLGIVNLMRVGLFSVKRAKGVLRNDFQKQLEVLLYLEMADFIRFKPKIAVLHSQITDLALANNNPKLIQLFLQLMRRFRVEPALASRNIGHLLESLSRWGMDVKYVLAPVNRSGFLMHPSQSECEQLIQQRSKEQVIFADFSVKGIEYSPAEEKYLKLFGISEAVA